MARPSQPAQDSHSALERSRQATRHAFAELDEQTILQLSRLTLPEIREIQEEVARVLPAGNLPAFLLSGLLKLKGRKLTAKQVSQDLTALLKGVELLSRSLYGIFIATPAAVLYAYQKILELAGKEPSSAFPQGTWQFYLEFGLREDSARHANETIGFQRLTMANPARAATAWICAAQALLYEYDELLAVDWRERVMLRTITEAASAAQLANAAALERLVADWNQRRPYHRPENEEYLTHRKTVFQKFLQERIAALPTAVQEQVHRIYQERQREELAAYQKQMSLLTALAPERYQEKKEPIAPWRAMIGFIWQGYTYLLPTCRRDERGSPLCFPYAEATQPFPLFATPEGGLCDAAGCTRTVDRNGNVWDHRSAQPVGRLMPTAPETVQSWVAAILNAPTPGPASDLDILLAENPRPLQAHLREKLSPNTQGELAALRRAPILINWDNHDPAQPLSLIRRDHRGIGDHALTLFRTQHSMVFDASHIFFDGLWSMAISELLTDSAIHWAQLLADRPPTAPVAPPQPLMLQSIAEVESQARAQRRPREAAAESGGLDIEGLKRLRTWLKQRGATLTINDLLLLYRSFHAAEYRLSPRAHAAVERLRAQRGHEPDVQLALATLEITLARFQETNPALLIPMDATNVAPKERLFPTTFRNPLTEILAQYAAAQDAHQAYLRQPNVMNWETFDQARRELLAYLDTFGNVLDALKAVTMRGESFNTATLKLLAHLPASTQHLLDQIPQHISVLNEIVKGNEVFSNVGRVAKGSTLTRFISAKDDGETKELVWGFLTNDTERMQISLRDFRAYVPRLMALGEAALADLLAQDYLDSYVTGLNQFVTGLSTVMTAKREA